MKTIEDINLYTWFTNRELSFTPKHFVFSRATMTSESKEWVLERLTGRFSVAMTNGGFAIAFEDPKEAMIYELTWG